MSLQVYITTKEAQQARKLQRYYELTCNSETALQDEIDFLCEQYGEHNRYIPNFQNEVEEFLEAELTRLKRELKQEGVL